MRKLVLLCHLSLDGIAAIPSGDLDWIAYDEELEKWAEPIVADTDTAVYGHITYDLMKYWRTVSSSPDASQHDLDHAAWIENVEKIVVSKSLTTSDWNNTRLISDNIAAEIMKLKQQPGKNITVFGSPSLASELISLGLVDEYRLSVSPIVLGTGKFLFKSVKEPIQLKLSQEKTLKSGAVTFHYVTATN